MRMMSNLAVSCHLTSACPLPRWDVISTRGTAARLHPALRTEATQHHFAPIPENRRPAARGPHAGCARGGGAPGTPQEA